MSVAVAAVFAEHTFQTNVVRDQYLFEIPLSRQRGNQPRTFQIVDKTVFQQSRIAVRNVKFFSEIIEFHVHAHIQEAEDIVPGGLHVDMVDADAIAPYPHFQKGPRDEYRRRLHHTFLNILFERQTPYR